MPRRRAERAARRGRARSIPPRWRCRAPRASASRGWLSRRDWPPEPCRTCGRVGYRCASPPPAGGPRGALRRAYRFVAGPRCASLRALRRVRLLRAPAWRCRSTAPAPCRAARPAREAVALAHQPARGAVFVLAGGPGQSATEAFAGDGVGFLFPAYRSRDVIVFDQRGTGPLGRAALPGARAGQPAERRGCGRPLRHRPPVRGGRLHHRGLGGGHGGHPPRAGNRPHRPLRHLLRDQGGAGLRARYPSHVERLALDSVVEAGGPDPLYRDTIAAVPRALRAVCRGACSSFTHDPVADSSSWSDECAADGRMRGPLVDAHGRTRHTSLGRRTTCSDTHRGRFRPRSAGGLPGRGARRARGRRRRRCCASAGAPSPWTASRRRRAS